MSNIKFTLVLALVIFLSCSKSFESNIAKKWKVTKMEKMVNVSSNIFTPINIDISKEMSYNFNSNGKVQMITQMGNRMNGNWSVKDSVITIYVSKEKKSFKINKITEEQLIITLGRFKFYLE